MNRNLVSVLCGFLLFAAPRDAQGTFNVISFEQLSQQERLDSIIAALEWRDSQLLNFSYELTETVSMIRRGTTEPPFATNKVEFRRMQNKIWIHLVRMFREEEFIESWSSWDGTERRQRNQRPQRHMFTGIIADSEGDAVVKVAYNDALGYRITSAQVSGQRVNQTRAEWLAHQAKKLERPVTIDVEGVEGGELIRVSVATEPRSQLDLWLDPRRDFMLVKKEYVYTKPDDFSSASVTVRDAQQIDGLWIPLDVVEVRSISNKSGEATQMEYKVSKFARDSVRDEDFELEFPPGTIVLDTRTRERFEIAESGVAKPLPVYEPQTGLHREPGQTDAETFAGVQEPFVSQAWWSGRNAVLFGIVVLGILLVVLYVGRRRLSGRLL